MLLEVSNLAIDLTTPAGPQRVVDRGSFVLDEGESLGVVGESGSGKTMTALALMGLTPENAHVSGSVRFEGRELVGLPEAAMLALRGDRIAMANWTVAWTISAGAMLGRTWSKAIASGPRPAAREASAYSRASTPLAVARVSLAMIGTLMTPIAMIALTTPGP